MAICPKCDGEAFPVYFGDDVKRWRCWCCNRIFDENEWIEKDGELVKKLRRKQHATDNINYIIGPI